MSDYLAVINRIIDEHRHIRSHAKLVGDSINDQEAMMSLQKVRPNWIPGQMELLAEKQNKLTQTISFLNEGLTNHFAREEKYLPPLLGDFLMDAIVMDHQGIKAAIEETRDTVASTELEGLSREELLSEEMKIQQKISNLLSLIEDHASREELILEMVQKVLEKKSQPTNPDPKL